MLRKLVNSETSQPALFHMKVHCGTSQPAVPSKLKSTLKPYSQLCHTSWSPPWKLTASCVTQAEVHPETLQPAVLHKLKSILKPYNQLLQTSWSPFWNLTVCVSHKPKSVIKPHKPAVPHKLVYSGTSEQVTYSFPESYYCLRTANF